MSPLIACCPILNVLLENEVKDKQGKYEGAYSFQGFSNERDYWVDAEGENAIWYIPHLKEWVIGSADKFGMMTAYAIYSSAYGKLVNMFDRYCMVLLLPTTIRAAETISAQNSRNLSSGAEQNADVPVV